MQPEEILFSYWGHRQFRPLQKEIVESVLEGKDSLALLPTGGGKSICFQVPGIMLPGLCLVISPLIALMEDQVLNLKQRGISAYAIRSGQTTGIIRSILDEASDGKVKFLYVSPERLTSVLFQAYLPYLKPSLIAVDEAHCISQWGYDFRPHYLNIAGIRPWFKDVPVLALTATATPDVVEDIQAKLGFSKPNVFQKSFKRSNLTYGVTETDNKLDRLSIFLKKQPGSAVVYVRNRAKCERIAEWLKNQGWDADYYHAGIPNAERSKKQSYWIQQPNAIMVATNAFGMGIDKSNVRAVAHLDLPDTIEAYFQEAGRAGRDENPAVALLMVSDDDRATLKENLEFQFPNLETIGRIYEALFKETFITLGEGAGHVLEVDIEPLANALKLAPQQLHSGLGLLERGGYIQVIESAEDICYLKLKSEPQQLRSMVVSKKAIQLCERLMRKIPGIADETKGIRMEQLRRWTYTETDDVWKVLLGELQERGALNYFLPEPNRCILRLLSERVPKSHIRLSNEVYGLRRKIAEEKMKAVEHYAFDKKKCRLLKLLSYFGEVDTLACGQCDVCISKEKAKNLEELFFEARNEKMEWRLEEIRDRFPTIRNFNHPIFREWVESGLISEIKPGLIRFNIEAEQRPK
ncbi:MAG: ATP-dependent DNA helicase RecQ [Bacteroidetes bacterium]|nr:ATP-dependent DNA helicase RecQ [Bacteroidota bacterium]